ncbi:hypothetical protein MBCUT_02210 [Methanobrevibacter cuticularis]|uniref:Transposase IS204/IS1001/IS1096/IS1165 zinc-finger domain-containing protein n=1 Tax=Methanobrevibacter cuticularis TaxID=47311 RepID=A0A166FB89_9EURY|nr:hypothetical protein MBCUT_02210 [Methanobrevibacter cuticularis]
MTTISKSALIDNIGPIQLKLFDCIEEKVDFKTKVVKYAFPHNKKKKINKNIQILDNGNYQMINPTCPNCGSVKQVKQGFREINPKIDNCEKIKISLQRYKCKSCNKKYSTTLENIKEENKNFFNSLKGKIREFKKNRGESLRKIARDTENFLNLEISHQSIKNFLKIDPKKS